MLESSLSQQGKQRATYLWLISVEDSIKVSVYLTYFLLVGVWLNGNCLAEFLFQSC